MLPRHCLAATAVALLGIAGFARAAQPIDPAARLYSEALARLAEGDVKVISDAVPIDKDTGLQFRNISTTRPTVELLKRHEKTLELFHRGAQQPRCAWSQVVVPDDYSSTTRPSTRAAPATAAPTRASTTRAAEESNPYNAALVLAMLQAMRSAQQVENGRVADAVLGMTDVLAVSRQMYDTRSISDFAGAAALESAGIRFIADHLLALPPKDLQKLDERLRALPPAKTLSEVLRPALEQLDRGWEEAQPALATLPATAGTTHDIAMTKTLKDAFDRMGEAAALPLDQALEKLTPVLKNPDEELNGLRFIAIMFLNVRAREVPLQAHRAMLPIAVRVALDGPDAAKSSKDPFGDGKPFDYRKMGKGFQLFSQLVIDHRPVSLEVGVDD
jgi:hypothetical protein